jgi:hypothetical protein
MKLIFAFVWLALAVTADWKPSVIIFGMLAGVYFTEWVEGR